MSERDIDQQIVERAKSGDQRAFGLLVLKYQSKVQRLLSRFIRNPDEVADITQEAFIKAYRALATFRHESSFYTWLYRIAVNCAKTYLAVQKNRPRSAYENHSQDENHDETFLQDSTLSDMQTPEATLMSKQVAVTIQQAVAALPEDLRTAITLREIEGMSYEEIAQAMQSPIGTVRSRIFRAREVIAEQLRPLLERSQNQRW